MLYQVFDVETTGLPRKFLPASDKNQARIVSISSILLDDDFNEVSVLDSIIKPEGFVIPIESTIHHGISHEKADKCGIPIKEVMPTFLAHHQAANRHIAYNITFDSKLIDIECQQLSKPYCLGDSAYCVMLAMTPICKMYGKIPNKFKWPKLIEAYRYVFRRDFPNPHVSLCDVRATVELYKWLHEHKLLGILSA